MSQTTKRGRKVRRNKQELSAAELEDQEVFKPAPKLDNWTQKKMASNMRRLKAVFNGNYKRGQKLPDGWTSRGYAADIQHKSKKKEETVKKTAKEERVERVMRKMKVRTK